MGEYMDTLGIITDAIVLFMILARFRLYIYTIIIWTLFFIVEFKAIFITKTMASAGPAYAHNMDIVIERFWYRIIGRPIVPGEAWYYTWERRKQ